MKSYNYFDDDLPAESKSDKKSEVKRRIISFLSETRELFRGDTLREFPHLRKRILAVGVAFAVLLAIAIFAVCVFLTITSGGEKNEKFKNDAATVCTEYIRQYGAVKWDLLDEEIFGENQARLTGLCYVRQMDFDNDSTDELMLCYYNQGVYYLDVWCYVDDSFKRIYSHEANSTLNDKDGYWISFYRSGKKYYICSSQKSTPEKVTLYSLHSNEFTAEKRQWDYDFENDIYSYNGKVNSSDFETIKLSVFRKSRADILVESVSQTLDSFGNLSSMAIVDSKSKSELMNEAYYEAVKKRIDRYGSAEIKTEDGYSYIDGVALVRLIDFDGDDNDELLIVYRKYKTKNRYDNYSGKYIDYQIPVYSMDVYDFTDTDARRIFSKESISNCLNSENENVFYLLLKSGKKTTDIYTNNYTFENSYNYTATSKIYRLKDGRFKSAYTSKMINEYGYRQYYIDNERVYNQEFEENGYKVPMFLDDEQKITDSSFSIIYLSGKGEDDYQKLIDETDKTITALNPAYSKTESETQ